MLRAEAVDEDCFVDDESSGAAAERRTIRFSVGRPLIIPMIIQSILLDPSGAV
jgi:hypothetical protein